MEHGGRTKTGEDTLAAMAVPDAADAPDAPGVRAHAVSPAAVALLALLVALALSGMVAAYFYYQNTLRNAQERSLTTMAETAAQNLTSYFDLRMGELDMQFSDANVARAVEVCEGDVSHALDDLLDEFGVPDACVATVGMVVAASVPHPASVPRDADARFSVGSSWESFAEAAAGRT